MVKNDSRPRPYVVVAEDHEPVRELIHEVLEVAGARVDSVTNGRELLDLLGDDPPDVVVMDLRMPGMDGIEATRRLRERWPVAPPRIVAMTGDLSEAVERRFREAGGNEFLAKPVRMAELRSRVFGPTSETSGLDERTRSKRGA